MALSLALVGLFGALSGCALFRPEIPPLAAPQAVSASQGEFAGQVHLTWAQVTGAEEYEVHRADAEDGDYELLAETDGTTYLDTGIPSGTVYWYRVRACRAGECSPFSEAVSGYPQSEPGPTGLWASYDLYPQWIEVRWDPVAGADEYEVEIRDEGGTRVGALRRVAGDTTVFRHRYTHQQPVGEPRPEHEYTYRVRATGGQWGTTAWSEPVLGVRHGRPEAPVLAEDPEVTVDTVADDDDDDAEPQEVWTVTLEWSWTWEPEENPNPAHEFHIFRRHVDEGTAFTHHATYDGPGEDGYDYEELLYEPQSAEPVVETFTFIWEDRDEDLEEGGTYRYDVRAIHGDSFMRSAPVEVVIED